MEPPSIISQYSGRYLTEEGDRFPALPGLAKFFEKRGLGTFIAGLWTKDLPLWLTWSYFGLADEARTARQNIYVALS
jgi:hypothetical protein